MDGVGDRETAELLLALVASPGGRATPADIADRLAQPLGVVSRRLREAQRAGLVDSAMTLANQPGRDRMFWLTSDKGLRALFEAGAGRRDRDDPVADE
jgi:hypothetical protein